jgi:hypothetical protein
VPKEASCIACDRSGEEECEALAADAPTRGVKWPQERQLWRRELLGRRCEGYWRKGFDVTDHAGAFLRDRTLGASAPRAAVGVSAMR